MEFHLPSSQLSKMQATLDGTLPSEGCKGHRGWSCLKKGTVWCLLWKDAVFYWGGHVGGPGWVWWQREWTEQAPRAWWSISEIKRLISQQIGLNWTTVPSKPLQHHTLGMMARTAAPGLFFLANLCWYLLCAWFHTRAKRGIKPLPTFWDVMRESSCPQESPPLFPKMTILAPLWVSQLLDFSFSSSFINFTSCPSSNP